MGAGESLHEVGSVIFSSQETHRWWHTQKKPFLRLQLILSSSTLTMHLVSIDLLLDTFIILLFNC